MKILVTGASSYVGARLFLDIASEYGERSVTGTYFGSRINRDFRMLDVSDGDRVSSLVEELSPEIIVHCAANASARWCEANPDLARRINEGGAKNVTDAANSVGARVILISSTAAARPINIYSRSKLAQEGHARNCGAGHLILRPALIIGYSPNTANDRPFNRLLKNLRDGAPAVYDTSWKFEPTWVGHISEVILGSIKSGIWNCTIPVVVPVLKSRYDIARDILGPFGVEVKPRNDEDATPIIQEGDDALMAHGLPRYTYGQIIERIISEIRAPARFSFPS